MNCDDMRDSKGIEAGATGLVKIMFPDKQPSEDDFYKYCVNPALEMRQRVRDELCKLDREYQPTSMKSLHPDDFQNSHQQVRFVEEAISLQEAVPAFTASEPERSRKIPSPEELLKIIAGGESTTVEFKATLRWSIQGNINDPKLVIPSLRTIVAFLNTEGGILLIGVKDDREILGIEADKFENDDKYLLHFATLVNDKIGRRFAPNIQWDLVEVGDKKILYVKCLRSSIPVLKDSITGRNSSSVPGHQQHNLRPLSLLTTLPFIFNLDQIILTEVLYEQKTTYHR